MMVQSTFKRIFLDIFDILQVLKAMKRRPFFIKRHGILAQCKQEDKFMEKIKNSFLTLFYTRGLEIVVLHVMVP
jgi:hypothetical protein